MNLRTHSKFLVSLAALAALVACSQARWHETQKTVQPAPFTGDPHSERQTTPTQPGDLQPGQTVTARPDRLCGHRFPSQGECKDTDPIIEKGDEVVVDDPKPENGKIRVHTPSRPDTPVYVPPRYLSPGPIYYRQEEYRADRFFVVQNIATEKLRLYERCQGCGCKHKLVLETDMVVGQDAPGRRSQLGSFTLDHWEKFYEDHKERYSPWYAANEPAPPAAASGIEAWTQPKNHGAFGWYTAIIGPNAAEQWLHGTWGWGKDGDSQRFISLLRQSPLDKDPKLASHGCTRVENRAIAFLREMLAPGAKIIKIYAREAYREQSAVNAQPRVNRWHYALTTEDGPKAPHAGLRGVRGRHVPQSMWLESGDYDFKGSPTAAPLASSENPHESGNVYRIPETSFHGHFLVDEGRLAEYRHPRELAVGGHVGRLPSVILPQANCPAPPPVEKKPAPANDDHSLVNGSY